MHLSNILEIKKPCLNFQLFRQKHAIYLILQPNNKQSESEEFHKSVVNYPFLHIAKRHSRVYMKFSTAENFCNCAEFFTIQQCWITMVYIIFSTFTGFFLFQHLYIFSMRWWCTWNPALLNIFVFVLNFLALDFIVKRNWR